MRACEVSAEWTIKIVPRFRWMDFHFVSCFFLFVFQLAVSLCLCAFLSHTMDGNHEEEFGYSQLAGRSTTDSDKMKDRSQRGYGRNVALLPPLLRSIN